MNQSVPALVTQFRSDLEAASDIESDPSKTATDAAIILNAAWALIDHESTANPSAEDVSRLNDSMAPVMLMNESELRRLVTTAIGVVAMMSTEAAA